MQARERIQRDGLDIAYTPRFIDATTATELMAALEHELAWERPEITIFGKTHPMPRIVAWHGEERCRYTYSGHTHTAAPWTPALQVIRARVEAVHGPQDAVLVNRYQDGSHSIGAHSDDEGELAPGAPIPAISLGATRRFVIKHRTTGERIDLPTTHGSLITMAGTTQTVATHAIPKTKKLVGPRISLTFRRMAH